MKVDGILLDAMVQLKLQYVIYCCICKVMVFILLQKTFVLLSFLKNSMQFVIWWNVIYTPRKSKYPIKFEEKISVYSQCLVVSLKWPRPGLSSIFEKKWYLTWNPRLFSLEKKSKLPSKKSSFSSSANSQYFFAKISWIGP